MQPMNRHDLQRAMLADLQKQEPDLQREEEAAREAAQRISSKLMHVRSMIASLLVIVGEGPKVEETASGVTVTPAPVTVAFSTGGPKLELLDAIDKVIRAAAVKGHTIKAAEVHATLHTMDDELRRPRPAMATVRSAISEYANARGWIKFGGGSRAVWGVRRPPSGGTA